MKTREICCERRRGVTIPEVLIASSVLLVVLGGVMISQLFGLRLFQIAKAKLGAGQDARIAISKLTDEIRSAKWIEVGTYSAGSFTSAADGAAQQGNAVQIYSTATNTPYIRYYLDTATKTLKRTRSGSASIEEIASSITNSIVFTSENSQGTVLTNSENNRVIGLTLSFYQIQFPVVRIGNGQFYDYYQLRTRVTRRALE